MNIINDKNSIRFACFKCLDTNKVYTVISTRSTFDLSQPHYKDSALRTEDIIKREDGVKRVLARVDLKSRFTNVEEHKLKLNR
tara:strand:- start:888 stop:1136 length:249 start_codon:yes stop_codon:yes gene_type:complete